MKKSVILSIGAALALSIVLVSFVGVKSRVINPTVNMESLTPKYAIDSTGNRKDFYPIKNSETAGYDYSFSDDPGENALAVPYIPGLTFELHVEIKPDNTTDKDYVAYLSKSDIEAKRGELNGNSSDGYVLSVLLKPSSPGSFYMILLYLKGLDSSALSCKIAFFIYAS